MWFTPISSPRAAAGPVRHRRERAEPGLRREVCEGVECEEPSEPPASVRSVIRHSRYARFLSLISLPVPFETPGGPASRLERYVTGKGERRVWLGSFTRCSRLTHVVCSHLILSPHYSPSLSHPFLPPAPSTHFPLVTHSRHSSPPHFRSFGSVVGPFGSFSLPSPNGVSRE